MRGVMLYAGYLYIMFHNEGEYINEYHSIGGKNHRITNFKRNK